MLGQDLDLSNQTFENFDSLIRFLAAKEAGGGGDEGDLPLEELLERTAVAPSFNRQSGQPPLNVAARSGNERATVMLLEKGLSVTSTTVKLAIQNTTRTAYTLLLRLLEHTAGGQIRDASSLEQALSPLCLSTSSLFFLAGTALLLRSCRALSCSVVRVRVCVTR